MNYSNARQHIVNYIKEELIGPSTSLTLGKYEEGYDIPMEETPKTRYGAGILFPQKSSYESQDESDEPAFEEEELSGGLESFSSLEGDLEAKEISEKKPENDYEVTLANQFLPSAMGFSCLLEPKDDLFIHVSGAYYIKKDVFDNSDGINRKWQRHAFESDIVIKKNEFLEFPHFNKEIVTGEEKPSLKLHVVSRPCPLINSNLEQRIVTFTLVNLKKTERSRSKDQDCYFQCSFHVSANSDVKPFLEYPENLFRENLTHEEEEMALLYRHRKIFAIGHGCAVDWSAGDNEDKAQKIETSIIPEYEVHPVMAAKLDGLDLSMWSFCSKSKNDILYVCNELAEKYKVWIDGKSSSIEDNVSPKLKKAAQRHMQRCGLCLDRIREGIHILSNDPIAWSAFQYMNEAMLMQHEHYSLSTNPDKIRKWVKGTLQDSLSSKYIPPDYSQSIRQWRPFQLAFILMSIASTVQEDHPDRDIVDLIWFPTGGGKTEAYLGLASFTIFYRRILDNDNIGTTAIMRYTLRLLTTQQFQRASSLICSMEKIRRDNINVIGKHPISIGLWVGSGVTPNSERQASQDLNDIFNGGKNKFLITSCPWCGAQMGPTDVSDKPKGYLKIRNRGAQSIRLVCEDSDCDFNDRNGIYSLPLQIIDEHIYSNPPTLLIGTVDKFAMMPWLPDARRIFAIDKDQNYEPPSLIIQDEMHLISGPLGSMVGLYETLINGLCTNKKGKKAKIVASTATISNATDQIQKLFCRDKSMLFPPQGLKAGDSFFADERKDLPGRKYVGIFATGLPSQMTTMVRVLSSLVQAPMTGNFLPEDIDPYWTSMIYFNSVRELGHACTLVRGDIPEYLNVISNKRLALPKGDPRRRYIKLDKELTSRISSDQVTEILGDLFKTHHKDKHAIDICLATNMIQVGLDVPRLSLMVIAGQPKTTSEYIQASSRAGREYPGLVFAALNPGKPRDRSHYEHFKAYHQSFYKYVEPTSITPFSVPVRDRALHALMISLVRYWGTEDNRDYPDSKIDDTLKSKISQLILNRVKGVDADEIETTQRQMNDIWQRWETLHAPKYGSIMSQGNEDELMVPSSNNQFEDNNRRPFATPTSMRNVDASCEAGIIKNYEDL